MLIKSLLLTCLVAFVACQTASDCSSTSFTFYNGYNLSANFLEQKWDWYGYYFDDGTSDTFDSYFYSDLTIDDVNYAVDNFYGSPVDYTCDIGTTDMDSASFASYTYNVTDTVQLYREFYAPRTTTVLRIIDTIRNFGSAAINVSAHYYGEYGSDSETIFHESNDYYWVSSDGENGVNSDPPFGVNAAGLGGRIIPTKLEGDFVSGNDETSWTYNSIIIPAGETRSIMIILGQHGDVPSALAVSSSINSVPDEIYANITASLESVVNWALCTAQIEILNPQAAYCANPSTISFTSSANAAITVNSNAISMSNKQFTASLTSGEAQIQYQRMFGDCMARSLTFDVKLPSATLNIGIDTTGELPVVNSTGGYGSYEYSWKFSSGGDLNQIFGAKATVTVTDKEGCTASSEIDVPELQEITAIPVAVTSPVATSGATQLIATSVAFLGFAILM